MKPGWNCNKCGKKHMHVSLVMRTHPEKFDGMRRYMKCDRCLESTEHTFSPQPETTRRMRMVGTKEGKASNGAIYASHGRQIKTLPPKIDIL